MAARLAASDGQNVLVLPRSAKAAESGEVVNMVVPLVWTGGQGMVAGIIMAFFVAIVYCWFIRRNITIKMPDGVPPNVANAFTALIPGAAIMTMVAIVFGIFRAFDTTMVQAIYTTIQTPLQGTSPIVTPASS